METSDFFWLRRSSEEIFLAKVKEDNEFGGNSYDHEMATGSLSGFRIQN